MSVEKLADANGGSPMFRMDPANLRATLEDLEKATRDQADWHAQAMRTMACRVPCNADDLAEDAHRRCRFGQWYYGTMSDALRSQPDFVSLEAEHRRVHSFAARVLRQATDGAAIDLADYDAFVASSAKVRRQLASLRHEVQGVLHSSDMLTGAYGRADVLPKLREWRALARRGVAQCCIAFMDVDDLKAINDTHGHTVGDHVLAGVVHYVTSNLRPHDKVFRYGGDEFVILLPGADLHAAHRAVDRIRKGLATTPMVMSAEGRPISATASFGLAQLEPDCRVEESIDRADKALLLAKASGRNRAISWDPAITTGTQLAWTPEEDAAD